MKDMTMRRGFFDEHLDVTRRYFLRRSVALGGGAACVAASGLGGEPVLAADKSAEAALADLVKDLEYLTAQADFRTVERGNPLPYTLPPEKLTAAGLTRESWRLEVIADPESNAQLEKPLSLADKTALTFEALMELSKKHSVSFLKTMTCNN